MRAISPDGPKVLRGNANGGGGGGKSLEKRGNIDQSGVVVINLGLSSGIIADFPDFPEDKNNISLE